jgi:bacterioferritin
MRLDHLEQVMKGDKDVISHLNKGLRHELTAISQYWLHYRLFNNWGYGKLARRQRAESIEEMNHADKLMDRIIFLDGHPNLHDIEPLLVGENVKEALEADLKLEQHARDLYGEARDFCRDRKDFVTMRLFETLISDEEEHIDWLETQLSLLADIGEAMYGQLQADPADRDGGD